MKFTGATIVTILSTAAAFSPGSMLSKSVVGNVVGHSNMNNLVRPMVASQEVEVNSVTNAPRKKTKEVSFLKFGYVPFYAPCKLVCIHTCMLITMYNMIP